MTKTISAWEARRNFGKLMEDVATNREIIFVESHGRAKAAIVPAALAERWRREWDEIHGLANRASQNADISEDEASDLIATEIAAARAERRRSSNN